METPPRTQMASYLERWEEQKAQSRRLRQLRRRSSDVGEELSFISAIERENAADSFDLPAVDAFPASETRQNIPMDDEFVDAATFLEKNELGGDDSFSKDVGDLMEENWEKVSSSGRKSDFFESRSRNLDHVELSSPRNVDDPMFQEDAGKPVDDAQLCTPEQQLSPTDPRQGVAPHDHFDRSSGLSRSGTALSSGYDVHFDNAKLMYTPNSLKYLQEKSRFRNGNETRNDNESEYSIADHTGEAETATKKAPSLADTELQDDPSPEYVSTLQQGPGVIKETLDEIDALIDNSLRLASSPPTKDPLGVELSGDVREFVRDYERPLESMLPLSRTTDSWDEDVSVSQIDDDVRRRSRDLERPSNGTEPSRQTVSGVRRSRSQEAPELDTICEGPCPSNAESCSRDYQSADSCSHVPHTTISRNHVGSSANRASEGRQENQFLKSEVKSTQFSGKSFSGGNSKRSDCPKSRATSATLDQSLAGVAATQNPLRDEGHRPKFDESSCVSDEEYANDEAESSPVESDDDYERGGYDGARATGQRMRREYMDSKPDTVDRHNLRFRYGEQGPQSRNIPKINRVDDKHRGFPDLETRTTTVQKQPVSSDRLLDVLDRKKLRIAMETAMMPRRCRRFLCSVGDIMTEQIVFTNGTNSVGRICVSLLPLSTGCQQFSVSPAVLELGPKASSAFHVTFNARYAGAVSGIFQFRGVGTDSLFHPYEVVIEASVQRREELEAPKHMKATHQRQEVETSERVQQLQSSSTVDQVEISPMFIRFDRVRGKSGEKMIRRAKLRLANNTAQMLPFKVRAVENLNVRPATGIIPPASEVFVSVLPIFQPFAQQRSDETSSVSPSPRAENWSLTVRVGKAFMREVSVVVDRQVIQMLPPFDEIARSRHQLSSQTDSFYYTKRGKRRGLYFHARAVEFGCCNVGETHEVPVYVCNGSKSPMTVFLQDLQEPFSCRYSTTTIEPRKFIEVMVTFTPKVVGKVATSLFAYSVSDKAVVTLVARGI